MLLVGWRELPVPRHPWDVRSAWASILAVCGGGIGVERVLGLMDKYFSYRESKNLRLRQS